MHKSIGHVLIYVSVIIHMGKRLNLGWAFERVCVCVCLWKHGAIGPWKNCQFWYVQVCTNTDRWLGINGCACVSVCELTLSSVQTISIWFWALLVCKFQTKKHEKNVYTFVFWMVSSYHISHSCTIEWIHSRTYWMHIEIINNLYFALSDRFE